MHVSSTMLSILREGTRPLETIASSVLIALSTLPLCEAAKETKRECGGSGGRSKADGKVWRD